MKKFEQYIKEAEEKPLTNVEIGGYEDEADPEYVPRSYYGDGTDI